MSKRLTTAVIGTGFIGRVHVEATRRLGFVDVVALGTADLEQGRKVGAEFGIDKVVTDYRAILDDPALDAVDICTPNALHFPISRAALAAGKHVICEKPLATSAEDAQTLVKLAAEKQLRNCTCHNIRFYPMVQHMRRMCEAGDLGEILIVQGSYSQDWLLYDTDFNWRVVQGDNGPARTMADIGSHWCDTAEHVTGLRITELCADLQTFHKTRKQPKGPVETFAGKNLSPDEYVEVPVDTEDFGAVVFRMGPRARGSFIASQVSAGRKNSLSLEIYGTKGSVAWNGERPDELWIGNRNSNNQIIVKDPSLLKPQARSYADLPGGHSEGFDDTFKQILRRFYRAIQDPSAQPEYPQFADGLRQMRLVEAELASSRKHGWIEVPR